MTPRTQHAAHTVHAAADFSRVTDRQTDTANISKNSLHLMHSMQPKKSKFYIIVRPHYRRRDMRTIAIDDPGVCHAVMHAGGLGKNGQTDWHPVWVEGSWG